MRIDVLTLFPAMFQGPLTESILQRAQEERILEIHVHDIRAFARGRHRQVDDSPYGGGAGMVMMAEPVVKAIETIASTPVPSSGGGGGVLSGGPLCVYLSPRGKRLTQPEVERLATKHEWILLLCGHYEGVDQRVIDTWIDEEISIGDYVLTGGELPAMVLIDALARQLPGVLGKEESAHEESFSKKLSRKREYPHYTRPEEFRGMRVPDILLSGNHAKIEEWRRNHLV
ncbi:tRNA (guanosine(37)-N1)-methyltransferase TrmD [Candidatus Peregrinibacteria bacterium]|nr:tRNA (guanosine(37)-N1)-methyltransferase TrmD [Candidatus Peregrinibacteria bacterium]MBI3816773.1 tRNA (guanosine(37)-N1)-methyltransferase TrmD [Candidatus Peregrinibacteria bacterium]